VKISNLKVVSISCLSNLLLTAFFLFLSKELQEKKNINKGMKTITAFLYIVTYLYFNQYINLYSFFMLAKTVFILKAKLS